MMLALLALLLASCQTPPPIQQAVLTPSSAAAVPASSPTVAVDAATPPPTAMTVPPPSIAPPTTESTPLPTTTPTPFIPSPTPAPAAPAGIVREQANLRSGPGVDYPIIGDIAAGQEVVLVAQNPAGDWIQVTVEGGEQVWIAAFLLDLPADLILPVAAGVASPPPSPTPGDIAFVSEETITLPTYPWRAFTQPVLDETAQWRYDRFDRAAYEASQPQASPQSYRLITLENRWIKLTFMPDLGGRLYQMFFKPTGNNELYQNPVIKPSPWGPGEGGNGWLAAGGIEWGLPVAEHGYAWADSWGFITEPRPPEAGVTVFTQDQDRLQLNVTARLVPDSAAFALEFFLENRSAATVPASYWTNAMLAPGAANDIGPNFRFIIPTGQVLVHSTGDSSLPAASEVMDWPVHNGRDMSRLGTWHDWLGFFVYPQAQQDWVAVYDTDADEGIVRIFPPQSIPGVKGFGLGWSAPIAPGNYTDDASSYAELQAGLTPTFAENLTLRPEAIRSWSETWYPVAGIGGVTRADAQGAAHLTRANAGLRLRLFSTQSRSGVLSVTGPEGELLRHTLDIDPAHPADLALPISPGPISFQFQPAVGPAWAMSHLTPAP